MNTKLLIAGGLLGLFCASSPGALNLLNQPESVEFDSLNNRYLVSNVGDGNIVQIDCYGQHEYLSTAPEFVAGLHICNDTLYAASTYGPYAGVVVFDLTTDSMVTVITIPGMGLLNDITSDTSGYVYVTDWYNNRIYKIDRGTYAVWTFVGSGLNYPNGIYFDAANNRLLILNEGDPGDPILEVNVQDSSFVLTVLLTYLASMDGLTQDNEGNFYISEPVVTHAIYRYDSAFSQPAQVVSSDHQAPTDILFNKRDNILAVPNLAANRVDLVQMVVTVDTDTASGWVPLEVGFTGWAEPDVAQWKWHFGDGDSAAVQSPTHTYVSPGLYDVTLACVTIQGDTLTRVRSHYIAALADTISGNAVEGLPGETVALTVSANNSVPVWSVTIPVEYNGDFDLTLDSFSTAGCRTEDFDGQSVVHVDPANKRQTLQLSKSYTGPSSCLAPGAGPVLVLYFTIADGPWWTQSVPIILDGYNTYVPQFGGAILDYAIASIPGAVAVAPCCAHRGNVDGVIGVGGPIDVADLTYLVAYLFQSGPAPPCAEEGNVDGIVGVGGPIDVADLTYLVAYLFQAGAAPPACP